MSRIRAQLLSLALIALLPLAIFAGLTAALLVRSERAAVERGVKERTVSLVSAVDAQLISLITAMQTLAASPALDANDLRTFHQHASTALKSHSDWLTIILALPQGQQVVNTQRPFGAELPAAALPQVIERVARTQQPEIGDLAKGKILNVVTYAVSVPVVRDGVSRYVLSLAVKPLATSELLAKQSIPPDWLATIHDRSYRIVARSMSPEKFVGEEVSLTFRPVLEASSGAQGVYSISREGLAFYSASTRSSFSGWTVAIGVPASTIDALAWRAALLLASGIALALAFAVLLTVIFGRRFSRPISALARAATDMGEGRRVPQWRPAAITEIDAVARSMEAAGEAIREREAAIEHEKEVLQQADRAKNEFLAMLSHELRNPLAAMSAASHILKIIDPASEASATARGIIGRQVVHMTRLVEDLLDMSAIVTGKSPLKRERFDLAAVATRIVDSWRTAGRLDRHKVSLTAAPAWVDADRTRLEQVIQNLLDNALKFTPAGKAITLEVCERPREVLLRVSDEGEGMTEAMVAGAFDAFVQGAQDSGRTRGGLGLGLALVKRIVDLHRGTVTAESAGPGRGSVFEVRLPAAPPSVLQETAPPVAETWGVQRRLLIIEDNADARESLRTLLSLQGHEVFGAASGEEGLKLASAAAPEVALVDIGLPDIDGYEVARQLRARGGKRLVLIALTGFGQPSDHDRAREAGFDRHLTKPVDPNELLKILGELCPDKIGMKLK